jgi:hypothetical protein
MIKNKIAKEIKTEQQIENAKRQFKIEVAYR